MITLPSKRKNEIAKLPKEFWADIAKNEFSIESESNSVVRYFVEKIAEKIGVNDKIVNDKNLKYEVYMGLLNYFSKKMISQEAKLDISENPTHKSENSVVSDVISEESDVSKQDGKESASSNPELDSDISKSMDENIETLIPEKDTTTTENESEPEIGNNEYSTFDELKAECQRLGVGYQDSDNEEQLMKMLYTAQLLHGTTLNVRVKDYSNLLQKAVESNVNSTSTATIQSGNSFNPINQSTGDFRQIKIDNVTHMKQLEKSISDVIFKHFRLMTFDEVNNFCIREKMPFSHELIKESENSVYIVLKDSNNNTQRIPETGFFNIREY